MAIPQNPAAAALDDLDEGYGKPRRSEVPLALLLLAPSLLVFGVFVFYPMVRTFWLGFYDEDAFGGRVYVGFEQYSDVLTSGAFRHSVLTTLEFAAWTVGLGLVLGLGLAVLAHQRLKGIVIYRTIFSSTVATSVAVASLMWLTLFNPSVGVFNQFLESIGRDPVQWLLETDNVHIPFTPIPIASSTALLAVAATTVWQNLGITFIIIIAGLHSIPEDLYESARVDGASAWQRFRHITIPMLSPTLLFASVVLSINAFQSFGQIDLLTEGGPNRATNVVLYSIYEQGFKERNAGDAAAQAVVLFVIVLALTLFQFRFFERRVHYS